MSQEADKFWQNAARKLARRSGHAPLTPQQAQKEYESLPDLKLSKAQIDSVIGQVTSGELAVWEPLLVPADAPSFDSDVIDEDVLQLNRNEGQVDRETDQLLNELRRKALEDGLPNGKKDSAGMDGDSKPPTKSS